VERDTPAPLGPEDAQIPQVDTPDVHATDDGHRSEQVESETPEPPGPDDPLSPNPDPHGEARNPRAPDDDHDSEQRDRDETE